MEGAVEDPAGAGELAEDHQARGVGLGQVLGALAAHVALRQHVLERPAVEAVAHRGDHRHFGHREEGQAVLELAVGLVALLVDHAPRPELVVDAVHQVLHLQSP